MSSPLRHEALRLRENRRLGADLLVLSLECPPDEAAARFSAGQFMQLSLPGLALPRPFSILRCSNGLLDVLVKEVGRATRMLGALRAGDLVPATWPLGNGFTARGASTGDWLLVGGGVGIAPLIAFAEQHPQATRALLFGFRDRIQAESSLAIVPKAPRLLLSTEDGSLGEQGRVTDLLEKADWGADTGVLCCGPDPMMDAVAARCRQLGRTCLLSLETYMGCGFGICVGCAVQRADGSVSLCCKEGPVFPASELLETL